MKLKTLVITVTGNAENIERIHEILNSPRGINHQTKVELGKLIWLEFDTSTDPKVIY